MALSVVDLYAKILPKTNCKDCGFLTCIAFAGMVVSEKHPLKNCPHIAPDILKAAEQELAQQYKEGKGLKKDMAKEALEWAIVLDPKYADAYYNLAGLYTIFGMTSESREYLEKSLYYFLEQGRGQEADEYEQVFKKFFRLSDNDKKR